MIIKTPEFNRQFNKDIESIKIDKNRDLIEKGSYRIKPYGSYITDIDLTAMVYYNERLFNIVYNIIKKNKKFHFIKMSCGTYPQFKLPWSFDTQGGCEFNLVTAKEWFKDFSKKKLVSSSILEEILSNLDSQKLTVRNLINIENILHPFAEIIWNKEDIKKGYVLSWGNKYYLMDVIKKETPVLEFLYVYRKGEMVAVDLGLVDKKHRSSSTPVDAMYRFYMNDWYKVIKSFRWKIQKEDKKEFYEVMEKLNKLIAIRYQVVVLNNLQKSENISSTLKVDFRKPLEKELGYKIQKDTLDKLTNKLNNNLESYVEYFRQKLEKKYRNSYLILLSRGMDSQIPVTPEEIEYRNSRGISCPFFLTDIEDFEKLQELARRLLMDGKLVTDCFENIAHKKNISMSELIRQTVVDNKLSLETDYDHLVLLKNGKEIGRYPAVRMKTLQAVIIVASGRKSQN